MFVDSSTSEAEARGGHSSCAPGSMVHGARRTTDTPRTHAGSSAERGRPGHRTLRGCGDTKHQLEVLHFIPRKFDATSWKATFVKYLKISHGFVIVLIFVLHFAVKSNDH